MKPQNNFKTPLLASHIPCKAILSIICIIFKLYCEFSHLPIANPTVFCKIVLLKHVDRNTELLPPTYVVCGKIMFSLPSVCQCVCGVDPPPPTCSNLFTWGPRPPTHLATPPPSDLFARKAVGPQLKGFVVLLHFQGGTGTEKALFMRLHLLQGIVSFHQGQRDKAKQLLTRVREPLSSILLYGQIGFRNYTDVQSR